MTITITAAGLAAGSLILLLAAVIVLILGMALKDVSEWVLGAGVVLLLIAGALAFIVCGIVQWGTP